MLTDAFENFRNMCIKVCGLDPVYFLSAPGLSWQVCLKKTGVKLELITDVDMLIMIEKGIRGGICHSVYRHGKANNKYMKIYDKNNESSYIIYIDANNLYGYAMSKKLPVDGFEWVEDLSIIDEYFIKNYDEDSDEGYLIEADVEYTKELHTLHRDLRFLPERMGVNKCKKLICNLYDKKNVDHISSLKQALNHGLILKKVHRVVKFNQRAWPKEYIDMNTEYRMNANNDFDKDFFKLKNNAVFGKTMENVRKHRDIKLVTNDTKRNKLLSEPNYHTTKCFSENLLAIEMKRRVIKVNKPIYLGLAMLSLSKIRMYEYWYDDMKPKYGDSIKLCYMDTESFTRQVKTEDFYEDIANDD